MRVESLTLSSAESVSGNTCASMISHETLTRANYDVEVLSRVLSFCILAGPALGSCAEASRIIQRVLTQVASDKHVRHNTRAWDLVRINHPIHA